MYVVDYEECNLEIDNCTPDLGVEFIRDSGCYYLPPELCKDMIINVGAFGYDKPTAIKTVRQQIIQQELLHNIPAFRSITKEVISYYASELADCLVKAADCGSGVEITIGYPKILVVKVY